MGKRSTSNARLQKRRFIKCKLKNNENELILVPKLLEEKIIEFYHFPHHLAVKTLHNEILKEYYSPRMLSKINKYVQSCYQCVANKPDLSYKKSINNTTTANHPMQCVQVDLMGPFQQTSRGNRYIFSMVDL